MTSSRKPTALLGMLVAIAALLALITPAGALGAAQLGVSSTHQPTTDVVPAGTHAMYTVAVTNPGDAPTAGPISVRFAMPEGFEIAMAIDELDKFSGTPRFDCVISGDSRSVDCEGLDVPGTYGGPFPISAGGQACFGSCNLLIAVRARLDAPLGSVSPTITVCGGGVTSCPTIAATAPQDPFEVGSGDFRVTRFDGQFLKQNGDPETQAGGHPHTAANEFFIKHALALDQSFLPVYVFGAVKDATVKLPPGMIGNPRAFPTCSSAQLARGSGFGAADCPAESQVGEVTLYVVGGFGELTLPVYNLEVPFGLPALFGFNFLNAVTQIYGEVRTGDDNGINLTTKNVPQTISPNLGGIKVGFWGVPADPSNDARRFCAGAFGPGCASSDSSDPKPFVSLPTSCVGPVESVIDVFTWQGDSDSASFITHDNTFPIPNPVGFESCNSLAYPDSGSSAPTLEARPTTNVADAPSGLDVDLRIPQNDAPSLPATAHLREAAVTLPEGLVLNPSAANGLDGCSPAELGLLTPIGTTPIKTTPNVDRCPQASRIGSVQVETPLLEDPLPGSVYVADPFDNPFRSLIAIYVVVDDKRTGIVVKLAGEVTPNPNTGQLTATFKDNPQLPFENFRLRFFGGAGGSLRTPAICGTHTTTSELTPWSAPDSGPPAEVTDSWQIEQNCSASAAQQPHAPSFDAGSASPLAGQHSPFVIKLRREDGSQNFSAVTMTPPQGLIAKLVGTQPCSDAALAAAENKTGAGEKANPSCPASSQVGSVVAGAGAGPAPYYAQGKVYLSGPYKGAPLSFAIVTPATAGPFDLGTIVVKTAIHLNSKTAEITAISDQIPTILQGIPLDVRSVDLALDRPSFTLNGTSCDPSAVTGSLLSTTGASANLNARFQLAECTNLGFRPGISLKLKGGTKRGKHPQLTATLMPRPGDANIASVSVAFPRSEFLENAHIRTICTRAQFAADQCPAGAIYGTATIETPLLDYPLPGNVYLRSSDNLLPDLVTDLRGPAHQPIKLEAAGRTDSVNQGIRNTFDFIPDAPFTKAVVALQGGSKGLLVNSRNICAKVYRATVRFTAHNGMTHVARPKMVAQCKKKRGKKGKAKRVGQRRG